MGLPLPATWLLSVINGCSVSYTAGKYIYKDADGLVHELTEEEVGRLVKEQEDALKEIPGMKGDEVPGVGGGTDMVTGIKLPQGISAETFPDASKLINESIGDISDDIVVQGSRASGTPNSGTAKERTMLHAIETGKIQAGEAGLRGLRKDFGNRWSV